MTEVIESELQHIESTIKITVRIFLVQADIN